MTDSTDQYINDYNIYKQHTISKYYHDQWNVMDFRLAGFDPDISSKYARFIIDVDAYEDFDLNADADFSIDGTLGSGGSTHSQLLSTLLSGVDLYKSISKGYKDIKTAQENYKGMLDYAENNSNAWWSGILTAAATVGATSWIPALGPAVGVARFILGGGSSQSRQPKPITLVGRLHLEGKLSNTTDINALEFITPGAMVNDPQLAASYNELPLHNHKPGIFNLTEAPMVTADAWAYCNDDPGGPLYVTNSNLSKPPSKQLSADVIIPFNNNYMKNTEPELSPNRVLPPSEGGCSDFDFGVVEYTIAVDYEVNRDIFNNNDDIKVAFTYLNDPATNYTDLNNGTATIAITFDNYFTWHMMANGAAWLHYFDEIGVLAKFFPKNSPSSVAPVTLLKAYRPHYGTLTNEGLYY